VPAQWHQPEIVALAGYDALPEAVKRHAYDNYWREANIAYGDLIARNVFLTGLKSSIRTLVLQTNPLTFNDAMVSAMDTERMLLNPHKNIHISEVEDTLENHEVNQLEQSIDVMVERLNKIKGRTGGKPKAPFKSYNNGNQGQRAPGNAAKDPNVVCRYCKKKGHLQKACFKRIRENGKMVDAKGQPYRSINEGDEAEQQEQNQQGPEPKGHPFMTPFSHIDTINVIPQSHQAPLNW
jgi:hypothetical protein